MTYFIFTGLIVRGMQLHTQLYAYACTPSMTACMTMLLHVAKLIFFHFHTYDFLFKSDLFSVNETTELVTIFVRLDIFSLTAHETAH